MKEKNYRTVIIQISGAYFKTRFLDASAYSFWKFPMQIFLQQHMIFGTVQASYNDRPLVTCSKLVYHYSGPANYNRNERS